MHGLLRRTFFLNVPLQNVRLIFSVVEGVGVLYVVHKLHLNAQVISFPIWQSHLAVDSFWIFEFASFSHDNLFPSIRSQIFAVWYCHIHREGNINILRKTSVRELSLSLILACLVKPDRGGSLYGVIPFISPSGRLCHYQTLTKQMRIEASEYNDSYWKKHPSWQIP